MLYKNSSRYYILLAVLLVFPAKIFCQQIISNGQAIYQSKLSIKEEMTDSIRNNMISSMGKEDFDIFVDAMSRAGEGTYTLDFNRENSVFMKEQVLQKPSEIGKMTMQINTSDIRYKNTYKDFVNNYQFREDQILGKEFLVKSDLNNFNWEISNESKSIGTWKIFKAVLIPNKVAAEEEEKGEISNSILDLVDDKAEILTAWFAPEIPVNNGPGGFHGLPGLILEVSNGSTTFLCTRLTLNLKNLEIDKFRTGELISAEGFETLKITKEQERQNRRNKF